MTKIKIKKSETLALCTVQHLSELRGARPGLLGNSSRYQGGPTALKCHHFQILCPSVKHSNHMALQRHLPKGDTVN